MKKDGADVVLVPVSKDGIVNLDVLRDELEKGASVVSIMYANNEIGTIQPIKEISEIIKVHREKNKTQFPLFHTDAVQAFQYLSCNVETLGVDLMTLSAHKIYGPKGVGALYVRNASTKILSPVTTGGGQESGFRSGTENVAGIVGFARAAEIVVKRMVRESKRVRVLRDYLFSGIKKLFPDLRVNGSLAKRIPNNINIAIPTHDAADLLLALDLAGIAASPGAACRSRAIASSHVLRAINASERDARGSIRFSLGMSTTEKELDYVLKILKICQNK